MRMVSSLNPCWRTRSGCAEVRAMRALVLGAVIVLAPWLSAAAGEAADHDEFCERKVRPILAGTCVKCHGAKKASGGLRLDSREAMLKGGDSGPAVVPGDPSSSLLVQAVRREDEALEMPPDDPLPESVRADLAAWVASGARWPQAETTSRPIEGRAHWAFELLGNVVPPNDPSGWAQNAIDRFIAAGHRGRGLSPVAEADRRALIRRASFDLTGLPPSAERV